MPRKSKRSKAQCLHWQLSNENPFATRTEGAECVGPQSSGQEKMSAESHAGSVTQGGDESRVPQVSYADVVKRGLHSDDSFTAAPSNVKQVNLRGQSEE